MFSGPYTGPSYGRHTKHPSGQATCLTDLPRELVANVVSHLPYAALPAFRTTCKLARELVDAASNGWVMKVEEGEALLTSGLLQRLTSLAYVWFERWSWEEEQEANFLAVILSNRGVFAKLQEVRFPGTAHIPFRCLRGLLAALPAVTSLALPPLQPPAAQLPADMVTQQYRAALSSITALSFLTDLSLEGWSLNDAGARILGCGLQKLQRLSLGDTSALSAEGYAALAGLTGLRSLTAGGARGDNATLQPLTALTALTGLRVELAPGFGDDDAGPLARLPTLRTLGWWHTEPQPPAGLRPGCVAPWLRELSLCIELDVRALSVLAECTGLTMMQVHSIRLSTSADDPELIPAAKRAAEAAAASTAVTGTGGAGWQPGDAANPAAGGRGRTARLPPFLPSLRSLILGDLSMPPPEEPQPVVGLAELFPALENVLTFQVTGRGLKHLERADRLRRLALNCANLRDEALAFLPPLPSLAGLQLEGCGQLTGAAVGALRSAPGVEQLLLLDTAAVTDAFLAQAVDQLRTVRTLVLSRLPNVHDEGLQALVALAGSLEHLELRCMPGVTPAGLQVVLQLPRVDVLAVSECTGISKAACRELAAALTAAGRDVSVEHETTALVPVSLADEFGAQEEGGAAAAAAALR